MRSVKLLLSFACAVAALPVFCSCRSAGKTKTFDLGGGVKLEMVWISPGEFMMGSPDSENCSGVDETQHRVTLTKPLDS